MTSGTLLAFALVLSLSCTVHGKRGNGRQSSSGYDSGDSSPVSSGRCGYPSDTLSGTMKIIAGQHTEVGTASYTLVDNGDSFTVTATLTATTAGCQFVQDAAMDLVGEQKSRGSELAPGRFPLSKSISSTPTLTLTNEFPKTDAIVDCCKDKLLYIHSNVNCPHIGSETVWAGDTGCTASTRWCFYEAIAPVCDCGCDASGTKKCIPKETCELATTCPIEGVTEACPAEKEALCPSKVSCDASVRCPSGGMDILVCPIDYETECPPKSPCGDNRCPVNPEVTEACETDLDLVCPKKLHCRADERCPAGGMDTAVCPKVFETECPPKKDCGLDRCPNDGSVTSTCGDLDDICPVKTPCGVNRCPVNDHITSACPPDLNDVCPEKKECGDDRCPIDASVTSTCGNLDATCPLKTPCGVNRCPVDDHITSACSSDLDEVCPEKKECGLDRCPTDESVTSTCGNLDNICPVKSNCPDCPGQQACLPSECPTDAETCGGEPPSGCVTARVACYKCGTDPLECIIEKDASSSTHEAVKAELETSSTFCDGGMSPCKQPNCEQRIIASYDGMTEAPCPKFDDSQKCPITEGKGVSNFAVYTVTTGANCPADQKSIACTGEKCSADESPCNCPFCSGSCSS